MCSSHFKSVSFTCWSRDVIIKFSLYWLIFLWQFTYSSISTKKEQVSPFAASLEIKPSVPAQSNFVSSVSVNLSWDHLNVSKIFFMLIVSNWIFIYLSNIYKNRTRVLFRPITIFSLPRFIANLLVDWGAEHSVN